MRLNAVTLENFRCYKIRTRIDFSSLTALAGKNDSGKSTILDALNIFFNSAKIDPEDASIGGAPNAVAIICEFDDLPENPILDTAFRTNFIGEYLCAQNGRLVIKKLYDLSVKKPKPPTVYAFANHPTKDKYNDLLTLTNSELKNRAKELGVDVKDIANPRMNSLVRQAIWGSIAYADLECVERDVILFDSEVKDHVWKGINAILPGFALFKSDRASTDQDDEAQDPMMAAVKEAIKEQQTDLAAVERKVKAEVEAIATRTIEKLTEMTPELARELHPNFQPPKWDSIFKISLTSEGQIPLNKRGSGVRRLILLNFFRAKAEKDMLKENKTSVIYAIEEPETSQHPENQKLLLRAFQELCEDESTQVILTTHTPALVRNLPEECLRYVQSTETGRSIISGTETFGLLADDLGILPDHDIKIFVGVEGKNDIEFLRVLSSTLAASNTDIPDLKSLEAAGHLVFIPCGGSNLQLWVSRLAGLNRPEYYLFDRDAGATGAPKYQTQIDEINADGAGRTSARATRMLEIENYLHTDAINLVYPDFDIQIEDYDDVPEIVAKFVHERSGAATLWDELDSDVRKRKMSQAKRRLCSEAASRMTEQMLAERDPGNEVIGWLKEIKELIGGVA